VEHWVTKQVTERAARRATEWAKYQAAYSALDGFREVLWVAHRAFADYKEEL